MPSKSTQPVVDTSNNADEWESLNIGLGEEWDFYTEGPLTGTYIDSVRSTVPSTNTDSGERDTWVHQFNSDGSDELRFIWGSYSLDQAFLEDGRIRKGDRVRVEYLGKHDIKDGKQQIRRYRVSLPKRAPGVEYR